MAGLRLVGGNVNLFFNTQIEDVLHQYTLDVLKDAAKLRQMERDLNEALPIGTWNVIISGAAIRVMVTSRDKRNKLQWMY